MLFIVIYSSHWLSNSTLDPNSCKSKLSSVTSMMSLKSEALIICWVCLLGTPNLLTWTASLLMADSISIPSSLCLIILPTSSGTSGNSDSILDPGLSPIYSNQSTHSIILDKMIRLVRSVGGEGSCDLNKSIKVYFRILAWNSGRAWCADARPGTAADFLTSGGKHSLGWN